MVVLSGEQPKGFLEWIQFLFPFLPPVISILIILIGLILSFVIFVWVYNNVPFQSFDGLTLVEYCKVNICNAI